MSRETICAAVLFVFSGPFVLWPPFMRAVQDMRKTRSRALFRRNMPRAFPFAAISGFVAALAVLATELGISEDIRTILYVLTISLPAVTVVLLVFPWPRPNRAIDGLSSGSRRQPPPYQSSSQPPSGTSALAAATQTEWPAPTCRIIFHRRTGLHAGVFAHSVWVDGVVIGKVRDGKSLELPVEPGRRTVEVTMNGASSPVVEVDLRPHEDVLVRIVPGEGRMSERPPDRFIALKWERATER